MPADVLRRENKHIRQRMRRVTAHNISCNCAMSMRSSQSDHLIITDMQREMAGCFSHEAGEATMVFALE